MSSTAVSAAGAGLWSQTGYDGEGRPELVKTYRGETLVRQEGLSYDVGEGFLEERVVTEGASETTYGYDADGHLIALTDPNGNTTEWTYEDGLQTVMTDRFDNHVTKGYDAYGRLESITDRNDLLRTFEYDRHSRLKEETWYESDHTTVVDTLTFTYNTAGQLIEASNGAGTYTFTYNTAGQLTEVTEPFAVSLHFSYDDSGNRTLVTDSFGGGVESVYDAGQLVRRIFSQEGEPTLRLDQEYDGSGRLGGQTRYDDAEGEGLVATSEYSYDPLGRLTGLVHDSVSEDPIEYAWGFDALGQLTSQGDHGDSYTYTYDEQGQLTGDGTDTWEYDANGNRDYGGYVVGDDNHLESDGTWAYTYDDLEGRLTKKSLGELDETWTYGYNHRGQLIWVEQRATDGGTLQLRVEFEYDVFGNRVEKRVDEDGDEDIDTTQRYAYDGWKAVNTSLVGNENWDVWADLDGGNDLDVRYLRTDVIDELFARVDENGAFWYLNDHLASVRDILDGSGAVVKSVNYDAFGSVASQTGAGELGRYRWTGREWDAEIELQYNRARYYDPATGRWTSQDPLGFDAGDSNLYRYVANRPTVSTDPNGQQLIFVKYLTTGYNKAFKFTTWNNETLETTGKKSAEHIRSVTTSPDVGVMGPKLTLSTLFDPPEMVNIFDGQPEELKFLKRELPEADGWNIVPSKKTLSVNSFIVRSFNVEVNDPYKEFTLAWTNITVEYERGEVGPPVNQSYIIQINYEKDTNVRVANDPTGYHFDSKRDWPFYRNVGPNENGTSLGFSDSPSSTLPATKGLRASEGKSRWYSSAYLVEKTGMKSMIVWQGFRWGYEIQKQINKDNK